jgi:hypothetical protein
MLVLQPPRVEAGQNTSTALAARDVTVTAVYRRFYSTVSTVIACEPTKREHRLR